MGTHSNCWKIGSHLCEKMVQTLIPYFWCIVPQWNFLNIIIQLHGLHSTQKSSYIFIQCIIVCHVFNFFEEHHKSFTPSNFYWFNTYQYFTLPFSSSPFELSISFNRPSLTNSNTLLNFSPQNWTCASPATWNSAQFCKYIETSICDPLTIHVYNFWLPIKGLANVGPCMT